MSVSKQGDSSRRKQGDALSRLSPSMKNSKFGVNSFVVGLNTPISDFPLDHVNKVAVPNKLQRKSLAAVNFELNHAGFASVDWPSAIYHVAKEAIPHVKLVGHIFEGVHKGWKWLKKFFSSDKKSQELADLKQATIMKAEEYIKQGKYKQPNLNPPVKAPRAITTNFVSSNVAQAALKEGINPAKITRDTKSFKVSDQNAVKTVSSKQLIGYIPAGTYTIGQIVAQYEISPTLFGDPFTESAELYNNIDYHSVNIDVQSCMAGTDKGVLCIFYESDPANQWTGSGIGNVQRSSATNAKKVWDVYDSFGGKNSFHVPIDKSQPYFVYKYASDDRIVSPGSIVVMAMSDFVSAGAVCLLEATVNCTFYNKSDMTGNLSQSAYLFVTTPTANANNGRCLLQSTFVEGPVLSNNAQQSSVGNDLVYCAKQSLTNHNAGIFLKPGIYNLSVEIQTAASDSFANYALSYGGGVTAFYSSSNVNPSRSGGWNAVNAGLWATNNFGIHHRYVINVPYTASLVAARISRPTNNVVTQGNVNSFSSPGNEYVYNTGSVSLTSISDAQIQIISVRLSKMDYGTATAIMAKMERPLSFSKSLIEEKLLGDFSSFNHPSRASSLSGDEDFQEAVLLNMLTKYKLVDSDISMLNNLFPNFKRKLKEVD